MSIDDHSYVPLMFGPSPVHRLERLSAELGGQVEIWAKREDCNSGLAYGGRRTVVEEEDVAPPNPPPGY